MRVRCRDCVRLFAPNEAAPNHCFDCLRAENTELKRRIRWARAMLLKVLGPLATGTTAWRLLDLRRALPKRGRR